MKDLIVYSSTCGCGHTTPRRLSRWQVVLDKVLHDLRHRRRIDRSALTLPPATPPKEPE